MVLLSSSLTIPPIVPHLERVTAESGEDARAFAVIWGQYIDCVGIPGRYINSAARVVCLCQLPDTVSHGGCLFWFGDHHVNKKGEFSLRLKDEIDSTIDDLDRTVQ